jgi:hypothetical protein
MQEIADISTLNRFMWKFQDQRDRVMDFIKTIRDLVSKGYNISSMLESFYQEMGDEIQGTDYCFHNQYDWREVMVAVDPDLSLVDDEGRDFEHSVHSRDECEKLDPEFFK